MNLIELSRIQDSLTKGLSYVYHSTRSSKELAEILLERRFSAGKQGGSMLGKGFYANQHLVQAMKGNYGPFILKAQLVGISRFLILDKNVYEEVHGKLKPGEDFIKEQMSVVGISATERTVSSHSSSADFASSIMYKLPELRAKYYGIVYTGNYDKESIVSWYPEKTIIPLEFSEDKGNTWVPVKEFSQYLTRGKGQNLRSSEAIRSEQRAADLFARYEGYSDEKLANAIRSQLKATVDVAKKEIRKGAFKKYAEKIRPGVLTEIPDWESL